jgi:hypothetical protein
LLADLGLSSAIDSARAKLVHEDVVISSDFYAWLDNGQETTAERAQALQLFLYDGQEPPKPTLTQMDLTLADDAADTKVPSHDAQLQLLRTRWPLVAELATKQVGATS